MVFKDLLCCLGCVAQTGLHFAALLSVSWHWNYRDVQLGLVICSLSAAGIGTRASRWPHTLPCATSQPSAVMIERPDALLYDSSS